jgi:hypothetical protein
MKNQPCPDFETILKYLIKNQPDSVFEAHLTTCENCTRQVAQARLVADLMQEDAKINIPPTAEQQALALFRTWYADVNRSRQTAPLKRWFAKLISDSGASLEAPLMLAAGLRAGVQNGGDYRQLLFVVEDIAIEVDMQLQRGINQPTYSLIGQVLGLETNLVKVEFTTSANHPSFSAEVDHTATFRVENLTPGEYSLELHCPPDLILIPAFSV